MIELVLSILTQLGLYGLLALSLSLVFGASRIVNLAVGDFAAIGGFVVLATAGLPFAVSILVSLVVAVPVLIAIERGVLARLRDNALATLLVTWGIGMLLRQVLEVAFGSTPRSIPAPVGGSIELADGPYPTYRLVAAAVGVAVIVLVVVYVYASRAGLRLRAVADNPTMAALLGSNPGRTRTTVFVVAGLLAVLAGGLYSPLLGVYPTLGLNILIPAFVALLLTRPGAFRGAVLGALFVVALQVVLRRFLTDTVADALFYTIVVLLAAFRSTSIHRKALSWSARVFAARSAS